MESARMFCFQEGTWYPAAAEETKRLQHFRTKEKRAAGSLPVLSETAKQTISHDPIKGITYCSCTLPCFGTGKPGRKNSLNGKPDIPLFCQSEQSAELFAADSRLESQINCKFMLIITRF